MTAEGSVYQRKDGRWVAQYRDARGKMHTSTARPRRKLRRLSGKHSRTGTTTSYPQLTVGMYLDEWMDERKNTVSHRTWRVQESIIRCRIKPHVGSNRLTKLSGKDVRRFYRRMLSDGLSASTVGHRKWRFV